MAGAESAVSFAVDALANLLAQEARLLSGVRRQVEWVETELRRIECFFRDTDSSSREGNERMQNWRRELRELVNSAEDVIDMFMLRVHPIRREGVFCLGHLKRYVFIHKEVAARHKVASEIADIRLKLSSISESRDTYGIQFEGHGADAAGSGGHRNFQEHRLSSHRIPAETDFVGFAKELEEFIKSLTREEPKQRCIFSVVGIGGLGKTTFATKVYNDRRVKKHFKERAWVSVSQQYAVTDIYTALLRRLKLLSEQDRQNASGNMDLLSNSISRHLKKKKYLIVLDDVWTKEAWDSLKEAFPDEGNGSRVLLTTRNLDVASHADPQIKPLELRVFNKDESWELFHKKTFPERNNCCPLDFEKIEIGGEIVEKCYGLPLAIAAVGGMLAGKNGTEWGDVLKNISWQSDHQGETIISRILKLSYMDLPYDLKKYFMYLGILSEDKEFRARQLIHMWAAEGLLQQRGDETVEEVGEDCVRALVQRSMIQVAETSSTGGIKSCRIHHLVRNIAISESKRDKFLQVQGRRSNIALSSSMEARRLAIHCNSDSIDECISSNSAASRLRSMFIYSEGPGFLKRKQEKYLRSSYKLLRVCSHYKLLRVLYLHNVRVGKLPSGIGDLIQLRYFGCVGDNYLRSLPPSIGNLRSLQTLTIDSFAPIEIPCAIQKMQELRHLQVTYTLFSDSGHCSEFVGQPRLEQISNLHTLTHVKAGEWVQNSLGKLKNSLRKLGITLDSGAYYQSIVQPESLRSLSLASTEFREIPNLVPLTHLLQLRKLSLWGKLEKLPEPPEFPRKLTKLTLSDSHLDQDAVATLEKLQNLRFLRLLRRSYMGKHMNCSAEGFPSLAYLRLKCLPNLEKWIIEKGAMRGLAHLNITDCEKLGMLPEGVEHLPDLKKLKVWRMPEEFEATLDQHLIQHIPSVDIR